MPHELVDIHHQDNSYRVFKNAPPSVRDMLQAATEAYGDQTYLHYEGESYSFSETHQIVATVAHQLINHYGVKKGDRVAIALRNYPEWVFSYLAIVSAGGIAVALNSWWNTHEMEYGLIDCGATIVFVDQERLNTIMPVIGGQDLQVITVRCDDSHHHNCRSFQSLLNGGLEAALPPVEIAPTDDAAIVYTSGSTGHPKGAVSTHRAIIHAIISWELDGYAAAALQQQKLPPDIPTDIKPSMLMSVPLFHVSGSHVGMLSFLRNGGKLVLMYRWDADRAMDIIDEHEISRFTAVPTMTGDLIQAAAAAGRELASLASVGGGGASRDPSQVKAIDTVLKSAAPNTGWGMTETNAIGTGISGEDYLGRPTSSGRCSAVLEIKVIDESGNTLPTGERGELLIRGTSLFRCYWNKEAATRESFSGDWFHTGDVAVIDEEGFLFIVDRIKNLVIRGGENIGCGEVEAAIYEHKATQEAVVFGVPDKRLGEEVAALVVTDDASVDEASLQHFLKNHLAGFQIPRYIYFQSEPLPRIASGKFDKRRVREHIIETHFASESMGSE